MKNIKDNENEGIQFERIVCVFEIFPKPFPSQINMDGEVLYLPRIETVIAKSADLELEFSSVDFVGGY